MNIEKCLKIAIGAKYSSWLLTRAKYEDLWDQLSYHESVQLFKLGETFLKMPAVRNLTIMSMEEGLLLATRLWNDLPKETG